MGLKFLALGCLGITGFIAGLSTVVPFVDLGRFRV